MSERHEAQLQIRDSEALHRTLTANLPDTSVFSSTMTSGSWSEADRVTSID